MDADAPACYVCGEPARSDRLCASCAATLGNARHAARRLSTDEKRRCARAAVAALMRYGYAAVRLVNV